MEYSSTTPIAITVILVLVAALFVWLSLTMAAAEGAVARVTRAALTISSSRCRPTPKQASSSR